ncbi:MAG: TolB family protein [Rhizomicrobium sp.]
MKRIALLLFAALIASAAEAQTCQTFSTSTDPAPSLTGRVVYQEDDSGLLYMYDFKARAFIPIDQKSWGLTVARNPVFSPDGKAIVFTAVRGTGRNAKRQVFYWLIGAAQPANLTDGKTVPNEDPHFSQRGDTIVWKQNFGIATADLVIDPANPSMPHIANFKKLINGTPSGMNGEPSTPPEASGPVFSPSGRYIYYFINARAYARVMRFDTLTGTSESPFAFPQVDGTHYYYPVDPDSYAFLYVSWPDPATMHDKIYVYSNLNQTSYLWNGTDCVAENADPAPVDENYIIFSRKAAGDRFKLYVGQLIDPSQPLSATATPARIWNLPFGLNGTKGDMIGANYTNAR